ncbi:MAG: FRG domain-containing protein [Elusimicrobia bacterium]|nr:FRG domain-containing protein [Elusimicrobiota bacterium]
MLEEITIKIWDEFNDKIKYIKNKYGFTPAGDYQNEHLVFYRGLADGKYKLSTTLERYSPNNPWSVCEYAGFLQRCSSEIESFTKFNWNLPNDKEWKTEYNKVFTTRHPESIIKIPFLEFWIYMRHNGFPSPLLDWSASPYVAAFFAFEEQKEADCVAIYAYIEPLPNPGIELDNSPSSRPQIRIIGGPDTRTHERHYLQQAWYTLAYIYDSLEKEHVIYDYEHFFREDGSDNFVKIIIPRSQRIPALTYLYEHNINHFSLMHSEESLLKSLAFKHRKE